MVVEELEILIKANIKDAMSGLEKVSTAVKNAMTQAVPVANQVANVTTRAVNANKGFKSATNNIHQFTNAMKSTVVQQTALERKINDINNILSNSKSKELFSTQEIFDMQLEVEKLNNKLIKLQNGNTGKTTSTLKGMQKEIANIGKGFQNSIKSVKRFALALFSVESIYSMLSRFAHAFIAQNEELGNKIKYMEYSIGHALSPVIEFLVNGFAKVLSYVGAIIKVLTGVNIFAGSYASYMKSANKSSAGTAKNINKQLSSIDEINNIGGASANVSAGNNMATPNINLEKETNKLARFSKKIKKLADAFQFVWDSAKVGFGALIVGFQDILFVGIGAVGGAFKGLGDVATGIIMGIYRAIEGVVNGTITIIRSAIESIIMAITGVAEGIKMIFSGTFQGVFQIVSSVFNGIIGFITNVFKGNFKGAIQSLVGMFSGIWSGLQTIVSSVFNGIYHIIKSVFMSIIHFIKGVVDGVVAIFTGLVKGVGNVFVGIINGVVSVINGVIWGLNKIRIPDWVPLIGGKGFYINPLPKLNYFAKGGVVDSPTFAMMGEYSNARSNPEIISPQSIMRQTFLDALKEQGSNDGTIIVNVGNKQLYKGTIEELKRQSYLKNGMEVSLA